MRLSTTRGTIGLLALCMSTRGIAALNGVTASDSAGSVDFEPSSINIQSVVMVDVDKSSISTPFSAVADESESAIPFVGGDESETVAEEIEYTSLIVGGAALVIAFFGGVWMGGVGIRRGYTVMYHNRLRRPGYGAISFETHPGDEDTEVVMSRIEETRAMWREAKKQARVPKH
eukprot:FR742695.1.p1 GENE.FR742695.1~~FR742695.1.p1  ORF type:complete len:189 (+),score=18.31 FR742695.1:47-568(+)